MLLLGGQIFSGTDPGKGQSPCEPCLPGGIPWVCAHSHTSLWGTVANATPLPPFSPPFSPSLIFHPDPSFYPNSFLLFIFFFLFLLPSLPVPLLSSSLPLSSWFLTYLASFLIPPSLPFPSLSIRIPHFSLQKFPARCLCADAMHCAGIWRMNKASVCTKSQQSVYPMEGNLVLQLASLTLQPWQSLCQVFSVPQTRTPHHSASLAWLIWDMEPTIPIIKLIYVCLCQFIYMLRGLARRQWAWAGVSKSENKSSRSYKLPLQCYQHTSPLVTRSLYSFSSFFFFSPQLEQINPF